MHSSSSYNHTSKVEQRPHKVARKQTSDSTFPGPLDWKKDMIDVPTAREIRELLKNKDPRLELVDDAFSEALAHAEREMDAQPQETTGHGDAVAGSSPFGNGQAPGTDEYDPSMMFPQGAATPDIKIKAEPAPDEPINQGILAPGIQSPLPAISRSPSDMPRFREDEYDPSHPARGQDVVRFERPLRRQGSPGMEYPRPRRQVVSSLYRGVPCLPLSFSANTLSEDCTGAI